MSVQDTNDRELTTAELEVVAGGLEITEDHIVAFAGFAYGACFWIPAVAIGNVGVLKHLDSPL